MFRPLFSLCYAYLTSLYVSFRRNLPQRYNFFCNFHALPPTFFNILRQKRARMRRFDLWSYSSLQGIADASIALRLLRSSFAILARRSSLHQCSLELLDLRSSLFTPGASAVLRRGHSGGGRPFLWLVFPFIFASV